MRCTIQTSLAHAAVACGLPNSTRRKPIASAFLTLLLLLPLAAGAQSLTYTPAFSGPNTVSPDILFQSGVRDRVGSVRADVVAVAPVDFVAGSSAQLQNCSISGSDASAFSAVSGVNLNFAGVGAAAQFLPLSCTSGQSDRTALLVCEERINAGPGTMRSWPLTCPACTVVFSGDLTQQAPAGTQDVQTSAGIQSGRLPRFAPAGTCAVPKPIPTAFAGGNRRFHRYRISSNATDTRCMTLQLRGDVTHFMAAYSAFDPNNVVQNYRADPGLSPFRGQPSSMSLTVPPQSSIDVVVHEVNPNDVNGSYTLGLSGCTRGPFSAPLQAIVSNLNDAGAGSLRATIAGLASAPDSVIRFAPNLFAPGVPATLALQGTLELGNVSIIGPGANLLELRRVSGTVPVLRIGSEFTASISGLAIANGQAGGIDNRGSLTGVDLHIRNSAGTGITNAVGATLNLRASAITGNANGAGSALANLGTATLVNSTVTGNAVTIGVGGALTNSGTLSLFNVTIADNNNSIGVAPNLAIVNSGTLTLINSILANPAPIQLSNTGLFSAFHSLSTDASLPAINGNLPNTQPLLLPADLNGGSTPNFLPASNSPVQGAGRSSDVAAPLYGQAPFTDQRGSGFARINGSAVDIGAVEFVAVAEAIFASGFE